MNLVVVWHEGDVLVVVDGKVLVNHKKTHKAVRIVVTDANNKEISMLKMTVVQKTTAHAKPVDIKGNDAPVDGIPSWKASVEGIVQLFPSDDGKSCEILGQGVGTCQVSVEADADMGDGIKPITGVVDVEILAAEAALFQLTTDPVTDQS